MLSVMSYVEMLFKCASIPLRAAVTYIRRFLEKRAFFLYIVRTNGGALTAKTAGFLLLTCALIAKITRIVTVESVGAVVEVSVRCAFLYETNVISNFLGNGGAVLPDEDTYLLKAGPAIEPLLNNATICQDEMFIFAHMFLQWSRRYCMDEPAKNSIWNYLIPLWHLE